MFYSSVLSIYVWYGPINRFHLPQCLLSVYENPPCVPRVSLRTLNYTQKIQRHQWNDIMLLLCILLYHTICCYAENTVEAHLGYRLVQRNNANIYFAPFHRFQIEVHCQPEAVKLINEAISVGTLMIWYLQLWQNLHRAPSSRSSFNGAKFFLIWYLLHRRHVKTVVLVSYPILSILFPAIIMVNAGGWTFIHPFVP